MHRSVVDSTCTHVVQLMKDLLDEVCKDFETEWPKKPKRGLFKNSTIASYRNPFDLSKMRLSNKNLGVQLSMKSLKGLSKNLRMASTKILLARTTGISMEEFNTLSLNDPKLVEGTCTMSTVVDKSVIYRRNDPGTTREDWCNWPDMPFEEMDGTLNVQQYIQQCIKKNSSDVETILKVPPGQEEGVWKYEHLRQFCMQLNGLTLLLQDECKPDVCVQMTATEQWIFLCAAHKNPKECSAIDYTRHTLDGAAALLNSNKYFPSRVSIKESSIAKIGSVCRRIYRIFSHAYFHHPELFEKFELETHLCRRFTVFVKKYNLMANEHLIVPINEQKQSHS